MKKWVSMLLILMLVTGVGSALGKEKTPMLGDVASVGIEKVSFDFRMEMIEGVPYSYGVPQDWTKLDLTEDEIAWGQIGRWQSPDQTTTLDVTLEELTEAVTMVQLSGMMLGWQNYKDVGLFNLNGREMIGYQKVEEGTYGMTTMIPQEEGEMPLLIDFDFTFAVADEAAARLGMEIASLFSEVAAAE